MEIVWGWGVRAERKETSATEKNISQRPPEFSLVQTTARPHSTIFIRLPPPLRLLELHAPLPFTGGGFACVAGDADACVPHRGLGYFYYSAVSESNFWPYS